MKKAAVIIFFLAASMAVTAQTMSLGPTLGINSWLDANNYAKAGLNVGATFTYSAGKHWAFGAEAKYSMEGGGKTVSSSSESANIKEDYIRVPLKAIYFFGKPGSRFRPKLYAGPSIGFLVGGTINVDYFGSSYQVNSTKYLKSTDVGLLAGTGFNYRLSKGTWLNVDLGYTGGLSNIVSGDNNGVVSNDLIPTQHNHNVSLNVGVAFPLGKAPSKKKG